MILEAYRESFFLSIVRVLQPPVGGALTEATVGRCQWGPWRHFMVRSFPRTKTSRIYRRYTSTFQEVTHIGNGAFVGCSSLVNLTISNSVTHIGNSAFQRCCSLASLTIPDSVTHIGDGAFVGCSSLELRVSVCVSRVEMYRLEGCQRIVATECHCDQCQYTWFLKGWVCPKQWCHRHDHSSKQDRQG